MIKIGDFSRLSRVSIKTLRYYDEMELFKPIDVDPLPAIVTIRLANFRGLIASWHSGILVSH